jgi:hypothetical protein|tara:strand:+ start:2924 stop:4813 length:1890 start_codon:yes stop_codon:yes gene_type:complete
MITTELDRYEFTAATSTISNPVVFRSSGTDVPIQNASDIKIYVTTTGVFTTAFATSNVNLLDSGHGHLNGQELTLSAATSIPKGLPVSSVCYVVNTATNDFEVALEPSGSSLIFIDNGSGTLTWSKTLLKALTTDYTVALVGTTATITWASGKAPGVGDKVLFLRDVTFQQTTDLQNNSQFEAESVESQLDLMVNMSQQLKNTTGRQLRFSTLLEASDASDAAATLTATASGRANKTLRFDSLGNLGVSTVNLENTQDNVLDAKSWATESPATVKEYDEAVGSAVSPAAYSAKEHAIGAPPDGSSKQWALGGGSFAVGTAVAGGVYSAKKYANDAAASADAAEGYTDAFDDRYLGSKSGSAPTVDNDGATLTDGALYFNTDSDHMFVYNLATTTWLDITIPSALDTTHFTASALVTQAEGIASNDNETTIPTSAAVKDYVDTTVTAQDLDFQGDSGGALNIDLDSEVLDIAGGTGITTTGSGNEVSVAHDAHTGDVTGATSLTIADDAVTYAKMQNVSATNMILGRDSASAGIIEEITPANLLTMLGIESSSTGDQSASEILTAIENSVDSVHYVDGSIDTIHIGDLQVTAAKVAADVATQAELDTVSGVANAAATTGKAIAMAIVFGG